MAVELVQREIKRFLSTTEPEVICLMGSWGIGKTFAWNKFLTDAKKQGNIALKRYSYVSLFGINSLDELKYSIFENSIRTSDIGTTISFETIENNLSGTIGAATTKGAKKLMSIAQQTPFLKNYLGGIAPVWFASVTNNVVCIDDIERRGKGLYVRDVLGLINNLKELKKCKVCLILNDNALEEEKDEFQKYFEKVVDAKLKFDPSASDSARIALGDGTRKDELLSEFCVKLNISNIRVIKKIQRSVTQVEPLLAKFDPRVLNQVAHSLALFGWSVYEPTSSPTLDYLRRRNSGNFSIDAKRTIPKNEATWNALLDAYGFGSMDKLDMALLKGMLDGYFDPVSVEEAATELDTKIKAGNLGAAFERAWSKFHDSFENNQDEVLNAIFQAFLKAVRYVDPMNLSSTVSMFKELGRTDQAKAMIKHYIEERGAEPSLFDLANYPFAYRVSDPDVIQAFKKKAATFKPPFSPTEILLRVADTHGWNQEDITFLAALSVDEYRKVFKQAKGDHLRKLISACLTFESLAGAATDYQTISKNAKGALKIIGGECPINASRVKAYGVVLDDKS